MNINLKISIRKLTFKCKKKMKINEDILNIGEVSPAKNQCRLPPSLSPQPAALTPLSVPRLGSLAIKMLLILLSATPLNCQAQAQTQSRDCDILKSDILNSTVPDTYSLEIPYNLVNKLFGISIHNLNILKFRNIDSKMTGWSGPHGDDICRAQESAVPVDTLDRSIIPLIPGPQSAFLLDLMIIKNEQSTYCMFRIPSNKLETVEVCDNMLKIISETMGSSVITTAGLNPEIGTNNVYLYQDKLSLSKPNEVLCRRRESELMTLADKIREDIKETTTDLQRLDKNLGSSYIEKLDKQSKECGAGSFKELLLASPEPTLIEECFQLGLEPTEREKRSPMSVIEIGGGSPKDTEMLREINSNFNRLSKNEKQMFKKLLTIAIEQKLEETVLENQQQTVEQLQEKINGIEHRLNIMSYDDEILSHITASVRRTSALLDKFRRRLGQFIRHLSSSLQGAELKCSRLICSYNSDTHLVSRITGLELFINGKSLVAEAGFAPSCQMTLKNTISRFHLEHLETVNATHMRSLDGEEIEIKCLKNYKSCGPELLRTVHSNDLIAGNILLTPAKASGFYIQCISPTNIQTPTGYTRCNSKRKTISLPIVLDSGERIGTEDLKIGAHRSPTTSLQQLANDLFRSNKKELKEARALGHHALKHLMRTDKVNSHHVSGFFVSIFVIGILSAISITIKCIQMMWKTKCCTRKGPNEQDPKDDSPESESSWKVWFSRKKPDEVKALPDGPLIETQPTELGKDPENGRKLILDMGSLLRKE